MEDKRFSKIITDPKFRRIPKSETKVKIDKRFQSMFTNKNFQLKYTTDKRGRPINQHSTEDLKRYYEVSSDDESSEDETDDAVDSQNEPGKYVKAPSESMENELKKKHKSDTHVADEIKQKLRNLGVDYARGDSKLVSESSSDDEETDEELSEVDEIDHKWGELDADAEKTDEITNRLAACNMDWDRIKAVDLMVLFNSFLPPGGIVKSVAIYPSEFGKKRMQEEEIKGPIEIVESKVEEEDENEEGSKYHMEKLRKYQLNRLKYFYAVVTFDSAETANKVYSECDGMEYESSATKIDLRFVPDDMTFDDKPKEVCDVLPELNKYKPRFFTTTALQQAKVDLTWDETDPSRKEITEKLSSGKIEDISEVDLQNYLASSSGEESESEEEDNIDTSDKGNTISKYKNLLQEIEEKEKQKQNKDVEMEISWGIDLDGKKEKLLKEKISKTEEKTPFEKYLEKRKQKRKEKRQKQKITESNSEDNDIPSDIDMNDPYFAEEFDKPEFKTKKQSRHGQDAEINEDSSKQAELELLLLNDDDNKKHFSLEKIQENEKDSKSQKKKKRQAQDDKDEFKINVKDDRFSALFTSHHYNIDPTDPHYKKTKNMEVLIEEKLKRRDNEIKRPRYEEKPKNTELNMLIKSVKKKSQAFKPKNTELNMLIKSVKKKSQAFKPK